MRRRSLPISLVATLALACGAAPALAFGPGETFLTGGLDLPPGALAGGPSGDTGDGADRIAVSADGRFVAFTSRADTLDPAADPDRASVYRKDRFSGAVVLVSRASGAAGAAARAISSQPAISDDGTRVAFTTTAQLDPADVDGTSDVYVRDVPAAVTTLATPGTLAGAGAADLSGDGAFVAFATTDALVGGDANAAMDVYLRDLGAGTTRLVSDDAAAGVRAGDAGSSGPSVSDDGTWVAFSSDAGDLVAGFRRGGSGDQLFARDMTAAGTQLVSATAGDVARGANGESGEPDVAGRPATARPEQVVVAYSSSSTDIAPADDASDQASVYRRVLGETRSTLISRADGDAGASADSRAHTPSISADGLRVAFSSDAANLGAGDDSYGVYLRHVRPAEDRTLLASADSRYAVEGAIAAGGGFLAWYENGATPDSDPDLPGVFSRAYDGAAASPGAVELVSRPPGGAPFLAPAIAVAEIGGGGRWVSGDGRYVVFAAYTTRLPGGSPGGPPQIYRRDTLTGAIELVSRANGPTGAPGGGFSLEPRVSADGRFVAFLSTSAFDPAHPGGTQQLYVRDLVAGTTTLASRADGAGGAPPDDDALDPAISADGSRVAFATGATNLGVPGSVQHVYVRALAAGTTTLADRARGPGGALGDDNAELPSLSADGRLVAFGSQAANLDPADPDRFADVYVRDVVSGATTLVSRAAGPEGAKAAGPSWYPAISADGRVVAFQTGDELLAPGTGPWNGRRQIVARTLATGAVTLVSRGPGGESAAVADRDASDPSVSANGALVAFSSPATNLLPGRGGGSRGAVYARTLATGALHGPPAFGLADNEPQDRASSPAISDDGQCLAFTARGHNGVTGAAGDFMTTYTHVVFGTCPKPAGPPATPPRRRAVATPRPSLTRASLSRKRFRVGARRTAKVAAQSAARRRRAPRAPAGTVFRFSLNTRANVTIALERPAEGRLVGRFCRRPSRRLRRNLRCVRFVRTGRIVRNGVAAGRVRIAFSGRVGRKALRPGKHRARLRASNAAGVSRWVRLSFRVVPAVRR